MKTSLALLALVVAAPALAQGKKSPPPDALVVEYCAEETPHVRGLEIAAALKALPEDKRVAALKKGAATAALLDRLARLCVEVGPFERTWELLAERLEAASEEEQQKAIDALAGIAPPVPAGPVLELWKRAAPGSPRATRIEAMLGSRPDQLAAHIPLLAAEMKAERAGAAGLLGPALGVDAKQAGEEWARLEPLWKTQAESGCPYAKNGGWLARAEIRQGKVYPRGKNLWVGSGGVVELSAPISGELLAVDHELALKLLVEREGWSASYGAVPIGKVGGPWAVEQDDTKWVAIDPAGAGEHELEVGPGWHEIKWKLELTDPATHARKLTMRIDSKPLVKKGTSDGPGGLRLSIKAGKGALVLADIAIIKAAR